MCLAIHSEVPSFSVFGSVQFEGKHWMPANPSHI
jgi:hypothetical protein